ncbi:glycosyltransferase family 2 protein [Lactiplantibacillus plantarum]|uniref:glycosyltransferase family 2 protein n=1 Tax=Lactiplantibacillus plantarum TaxID=1590 RepID=UPI0010193068|nr:glycosyltransferase family 2 protein [Lactiplantibacillus plantarum]QBA71742.1 glycosyltransferase family 2 protein [Lactiplantibacillus plantarum]
MNEDSGMVAVLMSTYNGEKYLSAQIESILAQSYPNIELYIRDDGSSDSTRIIISTFVNQYDNVHAVDLDGPIKNLGVKRSFQRLLEMCPAEYSMFADQDDIWLKDKITMTLQAMKGAEHGQPVTVHTNLTVVESNLNVLNEKMFGDSPLDDFTQLMFTNTATGCTMMINAQLRALLLQQQFSSEIFMHDWWTALVGSYFGNIVYIDTPTILYRQHQGNQIGEDAGHFRVLRRLNKIQNEIDRTRKVFLQLYAFDETFYKDSPIEFQKRYNYFVAYARLRQNSSFITKVKVLMQHPIRKKTMGGKLLLAYLMLFRSKLILIK